MNVNLNIVICMYGGPVLLRYRERPSRYAYDIEGTE